MLLKEHSKAGYAGAMAIPTGFLAAQNFILSGTSLDNILSGVVAAASVGYALNSVLTSRSISSEFNASLEDRKNLKLSMENHRVIKIKTSKIVATGNVKDSPVI